RDASILGMHDLQPGRAAADLAETSQTRAAHQRLLLRAREMKEAQRQRAGAVGEPAQQLSPATIRDFGELHFAFDDGALAAAQRADRYHARAVLVAKRKQEQQV